MTGPRAVVQEFFDLFAAGKIAETRDLFDPACTTLMPGGALDVDEHEAMGHAFRAAFPDARMDVDHAVESGAEIVVLGHFCGTHSGDFVSPGGTIPASGNDLNLRFMDYFKVVDGRIVDHRTVFDQMELLGQLGALPS
jgi:predicted ester cyclase